MAFGGIGGDIDPGHDLPAAEVRREEPEHLPFAHCERFQHRTLPAHSGSGRRPLGLAEQVGWVRVSAGGARAAKQRQYLSSRLQERQDISIRSGRVYGPAYGVIGSDGPPKLPLRTSQQNQPPYLVRQAHWSVRSQSSQRMVGPS